MARTTQTPSIAPFPRLNKQEREKLGYMWSWWIGDIAELVKEPVLVLKHGLKKDIQYHPEDYSLPCLYQTLDQALFKPLIEFCELVRYVKWWGRCIFNHEVWSDPLPNRRQHPRPDYPMILEALRGLLTNTRLCLTQDILPHNSILPDFEALLLTIIRRLKHEDWKTRQSPFGRRPFPPIRTSLVAFLSNGDDNRP